MNDIKFFFMILCFWSFWCLPWFLAIVYLISDASSEDLILSRGVSVVILSVERWWSGLVRWSQQVWIISKLWIAHWCPLIFNLLKSSFRPWTYYCTLEIFRNLFGAKSSSYWRNPKFIVVHTLMYCFNSFYHCMDFGKHRCWWHTVFLSVLSVSGMWGDLSEQCACSWLRY